MDQAVNVFEHGFDSIVTDFVDMPELEVSFDKADAMPSSVSSGYLCPVSNHYDNSYSASRQWCEVLASQFLFLHNIHDTVNTVPPNVA